MTADEMNELEQAREPQIAPSRMPVEPGTATLIAARACICDLDLAEPAPCFARAHKTPDGEPRY